MHLGSGQRTRRRLFRLRRSKYSPLYYRSSKSVTPDAGSSDKRNSTIRPKKKFTLSKIGKLALLILLLWLSVHSLIVQPKPQISVGNTTYRSVAEYEGAVTEELKSFLNRNKLTFNQKAVEDKLKQQFPEISNLSIDFGVLSQLPKIELVIAGPSFNLSSGSETYVVNAQGVAVGRSADLPASAKLPSLIDQTNFKVELGKGVLAAREVDFIASILAQCSRSSVPVTSLTLPPLAEELDLRTADKNYFVKFYLGGDVSQQIGQFLAARHDFDVRGQQPTSYLDVRVPGKVFYK